MNLICKINDATVGEEVVEMNNPKTRIAVRAILLNDNGEIAILHKTKKNEYKLVGGGVEEGEEYIEALKRECLEEAGCQIKIEKELGYVEEHRTKMNFVQKSYIYCAKVINNVNRLNLSEKEIAEGAEICWFKPEEALNKISSAYDILKPSEYSNLTSTRMIIKRDEAILKYFLQNRNI